MVMFPLSHLLVIPVDMHIFSFQLIRHVRTLTDIYRRDFSADSRILSIKIFGCL